MLRGIIFDFDGVVADSHPAHKEGWKAFLKSLGKDVPDKELEFIVEGNKREEILRYFLGDLTREEIEFYGAQKDALFKTRTSEIKTIPGLMELLAEIEGAGIAMAVASAARRGRVHSLLQQLHLASRFHPILGAEDVVNGKPDPAVFLLAASSMGLPAESLLVCEDGVSGVMAAKAAGMKCLGIAANGRESRLREAGADRVVCDFRAVKLDHLRGMLPQKLGGSGF